MDDMLSSVQLNLIKMTIENTKAKKKQQIKKIKQIHRIKRDANGRTAKREATKTVIIVEHEKKIPIAYLQAFISMIWFSTLCSRLLCLCLSSFHVFSANISKKAAIISTKLKYKIETIV